LPGPDAAAAGADASAHLGGARGQGDMDRAGGAPLGVGARADLVGELLDTLGVAGAAAVGEGSGGGVAALLAARGRVRTLVLVGATDVDDAAAAELARREVPTLLVWGEEDRLVPVEAAEALQERIPTAALAVLPGRGHGVAEEATPTVATLIVEFLRSRHLGERHSHAPAGPVMLSLGRRPPGEER
ncbi:MAG TPA: alpha/beta hydrolase, partial [Actinomycetota bacterium]|nr:alpha/beta hydrolase [Actinomycetota bacterium]